jgi:hypothetical protein
MNTTDKRQLGAKAILRDLKEFYRMGNEDLVRQTLRRYREYIAEHYPKLKPKV